MFLPERIISGMDSEDNDTGLDRNREIQNNIVNWIFLPLPLAILVVGLGILVGLIFKDNLMLQGPMRIIIGIALTAYGLIRSAMILKKLRGKRKNKWVEKS